MRLWQTWRRRCLSCRKGGVGVWVGGWEEGESIVYV